MSSSKRIPFERPVNGKTLVKVNIFIMMKYTRTSNNRIKNYYRHSESMVATRRTRSRPGRSNENIGSKTTSHGTPAFGLWRSWEKIMIFITKSSDSFLAKWICQNMRYWSDAMLRTFKRYRKKILSEFDDLDIDDKLFPQDNDKRIIS